MANDLRVRTNFVAGLVEDNPLTSGATSLASAGLASVPAITADQHFPITLDPDGRAGAPEVAYVTLHTAAATSGTILRAQEGTSAREHLRDTPWVHGATVRDFPAQWDPNLPPIVAHASDDEFDDNVVAAAWTELDAGSVLTVTEALYGLRLSISASTGDKLNGLHKACPAGDFAVWAKVGFLGAKTTNNKVGIYVAQDIPGAPTTADAWSLQLQQLATTMSVTRGFWTTPTTFSAGTDGVTSDLGLTACYLRLRYLGGTVFHDHSVDGLHWRTGVTAGDVAGSVTRVGLFLAAAAATDAIVSFIRFSSDATATAVHGGRRS